MKKDLQNGRSMIEMLGVLAIIGVLTVGGFSLVSKATTENKINNVIDEVSSLSHKVRSVFREYVFSKKPADKANMSEYICNARAFPDVLSCGTGKEDCKLTDCKNLTKFEDDEEVEITVSYRTKKNGDFDLHYFVIELANLSDDICMGLANGKWGTAASNGFLGIKVYDSKQSNVDISALSGSKVDLAEVTASCDAGKGVVYLLYK